MAFLLTANIASAKGIPTKEQINQIEKYAKIFNVNPAKVYGTIGCESSFTPRQSLIKSKKGVNGYEDSWGIAQIHLPAHPEISREEAMNDEYAIGWMIREFSRGNERIWSCYRQLYM